MKGEIARAKKTNFCAIFIMFTIIEAIMNEGKYQYGGCIFLNMFFSINLDFLSLIFLVSILLPLLVRLGEYSA